MHVCYSCLSMVWGHTVVGWCSACQCVSLYFTTYFEGSILLCQWHEGSELARDSVGWTRVCQKEGGGCKEEEEEEKEKLSSRKGGKFVGSGRQKRDCYPCRIGRWYSIQVGLEHVRYIVREKKSPDILIWYSTRHQLRRRALTTCQPSEISCTRTLEIRDSVMICWT